jgi:hypothetical protein
MIRSFPFKPNFYETVSERKLLLVDVIRIAMTLIIVTTMLIIKV